MAIWWRFEECMDWKYAQEKVIASEKSLSLASGTRNAGKRCYAVPVVRVTCSAALPRAPHAVIPYPWLSKP